MQRKPFRRLTAGRLAVHRSYRIESEAANQQYLATCIPPASLPDSTTEQKEQALLLSKGVVQPQQLQVAVCAQQILKELRQGSLTAFCSKENLLKIRHSMQPQMLPPPVLKIGGILNTSSSWLSLDHILELKSPMLIEVLHLASIHAHTCLALHLQDVWFTQPVKCRYLSSFQPNGPLLHQNNSTVMMLQSRR